MLTKLSRFIVLLLTLLLAAVVQARDSVVSGTMHWPKPAKLSYFRCPVCSRASELKMHETMPWQDFLAQNFQFQKSPAVIHSRFGGIYGGNVNLKLLHQRHLDIQAGGGINYSTFGVATGLLGNDHLHPNVNVSLGVTF